MGDITIIFPHQLHLRHPGLQRRTPVCLVEEHLFFTLYRFHKQKLALHRASMRHYADRLRGMGFEVRYMEASTPGHDIRVLLEMLSEEGFGGVHVAEPSDDWLTKRLRTSCRSLGLQLHIHPSPGFLNRPAEAGAWFEGRKRYHQTDFYIHQRQLRGILMDGTGRPEGGKWTYDTENRKRMPKGEKPTGIPPTAPDMYMQEAVRYVEEHFHGNPGQGAAPMRDGYPWAWTHEGADRLLEDFLANRLMKFGDYEDAMVEKEHFLHHSVLTPMLNIGLIEPGSVVERTLKAAEANNVPLNALEGFIRQVMGWREFIRIVYEREGTFQRTHNYWKHTRRMPAVFWTGETGIGPVDAVITKVLQTGYSHHIERLMVLGNFFLLCAFDPDDTYRWFMEMYVDAYDWVMVPNVYGMTQFADGGLMTTKPYISGSNYLLKMGDWRPSATPATGKTWMETWDGLFWRFMHVHREFFLSNPRLGMLVRTFDKMEAGKREGHLATAERYLAWLDGLEKYA